MMSKSAGRLVMMENTLFFAHGTQYVALTLACGIGTAWGATAMGWPAPYLLGTAIGCLAVAVVLVGPCRRRERTLKQAREEKTVTALRQVA